MWDPRTDWLPFVIWWRLLRRPLNTTASLRIAEAGRSWITKARRDIATHNPSYWRYFRVYQTKQNHQYHHVHHHHQPDPSCLVVHHWQRPLHRQSSLNFKNESDRKLWKNDRKMRSDYPVLIRWDSMRDWMLEHLLLRIYLTTVLWTTTTKPLLLQLEDNNLSSEKWKKK